MKYPRYLHKQGDRFYFRRRIPGFSTEKCPVLVSLGTKSKSFAYIWLGKLTAEFDEMLEDFILRHDELPESLIARYIGVRLKEAMADVLRKDRLQRSVGRGGTLSAETRECLQTALEVILQDGLRKVFPTHRICPNWTPKFLENVMRLYKNEVQRAKSLKLKQQLAQEFFDSTGTEPWSSEHHDQIMEVYLQARLTSLSQLDEQRRHRSEQFKTLSAQILHRSTFNSFDEPVIELNPPSPSDPGKHTLGAQPAGISSRPSTLNPIVTSGVEIIKTSLTLELLNKQFKEAANCDEVLHRSFRSEPFGIDIAGACERSIKIALTAGKIDLKTADSRRAKTKLFCLLANVQTVTEIEQYHLRVFEEQLENLPLNFNRSPKDANLTLKEIRAKADSLADDELGRAPKTFNSHLETIGSLLTHASVIEHSHVDPHINTKIVRRKESKRARKKRNSFKPEETKKLFRHTVWQGSKSADRRHEPGDHIEKDGLYFVPLIVAYTGGRMEEIAGLTVDAILPIHGHYGIDIRPHEERRLKNLQSERLIPLHEHLIHLGLLKHQRKLQDLGQKFMFPELLPRSAKKKFTSALRYNWRKLREIQLDDNPRGLDGHSLRHAFNQYLKLEQGVMREVRLDILGHAGIDLNEEVYGDEDGMPFELKKAAVDLLTRVF
jgi:integrase